MSFFDSTEKLDQAVEQLAPTAAITSRVLRKGLSLTQIYTQLVEASNELTLEREENERLKSQMDLILRELEQKAPVLQQQRQDYETAMSNIATLTSRLDELLAENQRLHESSDEANRLAKHHTTENQKLKTELADLARQVSYIISYFFLHIILNKDIKENFKNFINLIDSFHFILYHYICLSAGMLPSQRGSRKSHRYARRK